MIMTRAASVLLAMAVATPPALAYDVPPPGKADPTMRTVDYDPSHRWLVTGVLNRSTTITFGPNEVITRAFFGEDGVWSGPDPKEVKDVPLRNSIVLIPAAKKRTNGQIFTGLPGGVEHVYHFVFQAVDEPAAGAPDPDDAVYGLTFTYKALDAAEARRIAALTRAEDDRLRGSDLARARLDVQPFYGETNWKYVAQGDAEKGDLSLLPDAVSDNGSTTVFRFRGSRERPAILRVDASGAEHAIGYANLNDSTLVFGTSRQWVLRQGDRVLGVTNIGYDQTGTDPQTGTTSPNVVRTARHAKAGGK